MNSVLLCMFALTELFSPGMSPGYHKKLAQSYEARLTTCVEIADAAVDADVPVVLAVAVGYEESKFVPTVKSSAGAIGAMQVLPKYHCPGRTAKGCDLTVAGVGALKKYLTKYKGWYEAACHYNGGNVCGKYSRGYGRRVKARALKLKVILGSALRAVGWHELYVMDKCGRCPECCVSTPKLSPADIHRAMSNQCNEYQIGSPLFNSCMKEKESH